MLFAAWRDLQWRRRRFAIAVVATGLVFSMTLLLSGVIEGFDVQATRSVDQFDADLWVTRQGAAGPFVGAAPLPIEDARKVANEPGVSSADPVIFTRSTVDTANGPRDVNVLGVSPAGATTPKPDVGRPLAASGEIMASTLLGRSIGEVVQLGGRPFRIAGTLRDSSAIGGVPNVFMTVEDAQTVGFAGLPIVSSVAVRGTLANAPAGMAVFTPRQAVGDITRPLKDAVSAIGFVALLLWLVAACVIGSVVYLSALERVRDFAVFKATGSTNTSLLGGLAVQSAILALAAAAFGTAIALVLAPRMAVPVSITATNLAALPVLAVLVGLLASLAGLRRVVSVDPAQAFGGP